MMMNTAERIQFEKEVGLDAGQDYNLLSRTDVNWLDAVLTTVPRCKATNCLSIGLLTG